MEQYLAMSTQSLLTWASRLGPTVAEVMQAIFADKAVDGLRPARAMIRLGQHYGRDRLEAACRRSMRCGLGSYQSVKNILVGNLDRLPEEQPAEAPQGQTLFRFQGDQGYFDPAELEVHHG